MAQADLAHPIRTAMSDLKIAWHPGIAKSTVRVSRKRLSPSPFGGRELESILTTFSYSDLPRCRAPLLFPSHVLP